MLILKNNKQEKWARKASIFSVVIVDHANGSLEHGILEYPSLFDAYLQEAKSYFEDFENSENYSIKLIKEYFCKRDCTIDIIEV